MSEKTYTVSRILDNGDLYYVRYGAGEEQKVIEYLVREVNNKRLGLKWFDAAVLSHQIGQNIRGELEKYKNI